MDPDTQNSMTDTQHMGQDRGRAPRVHQMALRSLWDVPQHHLTAWIFASRKEKKATVPPRDQTVEGADQKRLIFTLRSLECGFLFLTKCPPESPSCEVPKSKPQPADSGGGSEKPPCSGVSDEGTSQEFIKYLSSCQKQPHPPFLVR